MTRERRFGPLAVRLAAAFVAVAVIAVSILAALIIVAATNRTDTLVEQQHDATARDTAAALSLAFRAGNGWSGANLNAAGAVAASSQARLVLATDSGEVIPTPTDTLMAEMYGASGVEQPRGHPVTVAVMVGSRRVGNATLTFPLAHDTPADQLRSALWRTAILGAIAAAAVAVAVSLFVASRLSRPVAALDSAARRLAAGDRSARVEVVGPGELGTLAATFDEMAEQLQTEDRLRRQLVTDVAHELRTPLMILQGETEALLDGIIEPDDAALGSLHDEVARLTRLVTDLELLAMADASRLALKVERIDLAEIAARSAASVRAAAGERNLVLVEQPAPAVVSGDADRLQQVVLNLLSNAMKFTPPGGTITVRCGSADGQAFLEVCDEGPGLAADEVEHLFDRFWQGTAGKAAGGSGIGLAVAAEIVAAHGGTLVAANRDHGARFALHLPLAG